MKHLFIVDYIYYCIFKIMMKSPSRNQPHVSSVVFMAMMIAIHLIFLFLLAKIFININVSKLTIKVFIGLVIFFSIAILAYYYDWKKNGERVIKYYADKIGEKKSVVIGYIIFFETFLFPFIVGGFLYFLEG